MIDECHVLVGGTMTMSRKWIVAGDTDEPQHIPLPSYLLVTPKRRVLVDTGCSEAAACDAQAAWGKLASLYQPDISKEEYLRAQLERVGYGVDDITDVVLTHLHMDHAGGARVFPTAQLWIQSAEMRWALAPARFARGGYIRSELPDPSSNSIRLLEGDTQLIEGVFAILTPGHTPGHQSVLFRLKDGGRWVCLVGDAAYDRSIFESSRLPGVVWNAERYYESLSRLRVLEQAFGAHLVFGHDWDQSI